MGTTWARARGGGYEPIAMFRPHAPNAAPMPRPAPMVHCNLKSAPNVRDRFYHPVFAMSASGFGRGYFLLILQRPTSQANSRKSIRGTAAIPAIATLTVYKEAINPKTKRVTTSMKILSLLLGRWPPAFLYL